MRLLQLLLFCFLQAIISIAHAADKKPTIEKTPAWITVTKTDYSQTHLDDEAEDGYADLRYEQQVSLEHKVTYYKKAVHILSESGVQNSSQVSVDFDPSYESLAFHSIKIIRGGEVMDALNLSKIKTIQQEKELNRFLYNGTLTAVLILEDVRKDDVIEYSYTVKGFNPIFKNKYADFYVTQFSVPVYNVLFKLVVPTGRSVTIKNSLTDVQPSVTTTATGTQYEWLLKNTDALRLDDNLPSWYDCYPAVIVSEYKSWAEVADWATDLFPFGTSLTGGLQKKVAEIKQKYSSTDERVLAALRFVQDDVRYMGIEMGENSHKPHSPAQIFAQRFGDCKDKAYLLCTLLKAMDVDAWPVLNNTGYKKTIGAWLPSPHNFDHCTVKAVVAGETYWFDATASYQRGPLQNISYPDYQTGLVIDQGTTGLTTIPLQESGKIVSKEIFTVKRLNGPVQLQVVTQSSGSFADNVRYSYKSNSNKELLKQYKDLYTGYFKKLEADSLVYTDDEQTGTITSKEYYTIGDFWKAEDGKTKASIEPYFINSIIKKPDEEKRSMPYALLYPAHYEEQIEIHLPEDWPVEEWSQNIIAPSFALNYTYSQPAADVVLLTYRYNTKADHVLPEETTAYLEKLDEAAKTMAFHLTQDGEGRSYISTSSGSSATSAYTIAYVILGFLALGTYLYRSSVKRSNYWD